MEDFLLPGTDSVQCVVEHHLDAQKLAATKPRIYANGLDCFASAADYTGRSIAGTSAGTAILSRKSLCMQPLDPYLVSRVLGAESATSSRWQAALLRLKGSTILIVTAYLVHTIGLANENLVLLEQLLILVKSVGLPCIMSADWQMHPRELFQSDWPRRANLVLAEPPGCQATCNINSDRASYLDYFLVSPQLLPLVSVSSVLQTAWKTHIALRMTLIARVHQHLAPVLRIPKQLPALPVLDGKHVFVQTTWHKAQQLAEQHISRFAPNSGVIGLEPHLLQRLPHAQQEITRNFALASTKAELYTCLSANVPEHECAKYLGRGHMPAVLLRSPFQRNYGKTKYYCPKCDFWTRLETTLSWLTGAPKLTDAHLHQCIIDLRRMLPGIQTYWSKVRKHNCPISAWAAWIQGLSPQVLREENVGYTINRTQTWLQRAVAQKELAVSIRVRNSRLGFKSWLNASLQQGAAVAHSYISASNVTAPTPPFSLNSIFNQWGNLWQNCRPQEVSDDPCMLVKNWTPWYMQKEQCIDYIAKSAQEEHEYFQKCTDVKPGGDPVLDFGNDEVAAAVRSYPSKKKPGADAWQPAQLKGLPAEVLAPFTSVLCGVQRAAAWPAQMLFNLGSLIAKVSGDGQRPISKTPMLYRIWCILRGERVKTWGKENCPAWDTASPGKSAETEACARLWLMEVAQLSGNEAAALLWDMEKFFDTISPSEVRRAAVSRGYPTTELKLALAMHRAPRLLQMIGVCASAILPGRSILQGCFHSGFFARLTTWAPVQRCVSDLEAERVANKTTAQVKTSTFVDDVAQVSIGKLKHVAYALAVTGVSFVASIRQCKLVISNKSLIVASDMRLAKIISSAIFKQTKIKLLTCTAGRDLGIQLVATNRRNTSLQSKRVAKTIGKLKRIAPLAKSMKRARKLIATGALPACLWGSASIGLAPTRINQLRTMTAAACGIGGRGRCASTAIAISLGPEKDPEVLALTKQASVFIDVWKSDSRLRALSTRYWSSVVERVAPANTVQWNAVRSTLSATVAAFHQRGWRLVSPASWFDPKGQEWQADFNAPKKPFLQAIAAHSVQDIWTAAATFHDGGGLQHGVHWSSTLALHKRLSKVSAQDDEEHELCQLEDHADHFSPSALSFLELFLAGGYWTNDRAAKAGLSNNSTCPRCGYWCEDSLHFFWTCPKNALILDPRVKDTQTLVQQARDGVKDAPCLWLRGMLPMSLLHINTPYSETSELQLVCRFIEPCCWPGGEYYTDAGGGRHNAFPLLRRCGFGIALLRHDFSESALLSANDPEDLMVFGAFGVLPGNRHTVPRAELYAMLEVVLNLQEHAVATITSDSKINIDLHESGQAHAINSANGDLWSNIYDVINDRSLKVAFRWSKGHATTDIVAKYAITAKDACGNYMADELANRAANFHEVFGDDEFAVKWHTQLVHRIQARAVTILCLLGLRQVPKTPKADTIRAASIPLSGQMIQSEHSFTRMGKTLFCFKCHSTSPVGIRAAKEWLRTPCRPDAILASTYSAGTVRPTRIPTGRTIRIGKAEIHPSHRIMVFKGLHFCRDCACYAVKKLENLAIPCVPVGKTAEATRRKKLAVVSLLQGKLPRGISQWPNSTHNFIDVYED